jgi:3-deoxy-D-manno-octulosonic-acid transferase
MQIFYRLGIWFYSSLVLIASIFNHKAKLRVKGYRDTFAYLKSIPKKSKKRIWFHCASLGEFEQGRPLIEKLQNDPNLEVFVSFFSPSGFEIIQKKNSVNNIFYLPPDTRRNANKMIQLLEPDVCIFVKYEFWANLIFALKKNKVKLYCVSGLFRDGQIYFKYRFFKNVLRSFDQIFVQNEISKSLLNSINYKDVKVTGDTRFDRVVNGVQSAKKIENVERFLNGEKCFLIGSSWPDDEKNLFPLICDPEFSGKSIIAPHNIDASHVKNILENLGEKAIAYSAIEGQDLSKFQFLIIDNIGMLSNLYQYGDVAYVGGAFHGSLHNILEPAAFGLPVIFGPKFEKFPEGKTFIEHGIGLSVNDQNELTNAFYHFKENHPEVTLKVKSFVNGNIGATDLIYKELIQTL